MWTTVWWWHCRYHLCFFVITSCFQAAFFRYSHFFRYLFAVLSFSIVKRRLYMNNKYSSSKQREHVYLINAKFISLLILIMTVECINEFKLKTTECIFLPTNSENCITKGNVGLIWFWHRSKYHLGLYHLGENQFLICCVLISIKF